MNRERPRRGKNFVIGGSIIGSVVGDNNRDTHITVHSIHESGAASLEDLQEAIALLRDQIEAAVGSEIDEATDGRIQYELETIEEELDEDEPDEAVVRSRWKQVQKLLGPLQQVADIARSAEQIVTLIRTLFGGS